MKSCLNCSNEFESTGNNQKFCTKKCQTSFAYKRYYNKHADKMKLKRDQENSYAEKRMMYRVRSRAKSNGIEFNLDIEDINIPDICPVLEIPLVSNHGRQGYFPNSPSLDRISPELGYVKGNVRVISARANLLKNDAKVWELKKVLKDLENLGFE